jgi:lipid-binding SYLF domain-containing protein
MAYRKMCLGSTAAVSTALGDTSSDVGASKQLFFASDARGFFAGLKLKF